MTWHERILIKKRNETIISVVFTILFMFSIALWYYATGKSFEWEAITPIDAPLSFSFYSAVTFRTLGALLFTGLFYKFLYLPFRGKGKRAYRDYQNVKAYIWLVLMAIMYYVVDVIINGLNAVLSFFYNIYFLILYLFPSLGISVLVFCIGWFVLKKYKRQSK